MANINPSIISIKNVSKNQQIDFLKDLTKLSHTKPVLVVIKAEWCGFCQRFSKNTWNEFKTANIGNRRLQIVEIDDDALRWLRENNHKGLHDLLLAEPPRVYFPQVYMIHKGEKITHQPDYTEKKRGKPNTALINFNQWVNEFLPHRKSWQSNRKRTGWSGQKTGLKKNSSSLGETPKTQKTVRSRTASKVTSTTKKSLKEEIDAAFRKLLLH